jgi:adenylate kinase family enzyme
MMSSGFSLPVDALLLIGPTGSGKSPLGDYLTAQGLLGKRCYHFDFGSELRSIAAGNGAFSSFSLSEIEFIRHVLKNGHLLENDRFTLARKIFILALERFRFRDGDLLVLNGIPRHAGQARDIASLAVVNALVVLECSTDAVFCRLLENVGGDRDGRPDDTRELVVRKLQTFQERTTPLVQHYQQNGSMIYRVTIDDRTTTHDAYRQLVSLAAAYPPFPFVAEPPQ